MIKLRLETALKVLILHRDNYFLDEREAEQKALEIANALRSFNNKHNRRRFLGVGPLKLPGTSNNFVL